MIPSILIMMLPALVLIAFGVIFKFIEQYFAAAYLWWGIIFGILSFSTTLIAIKNARRQNLIPTSRGFYYAGLIAWALSFLALVCVNSTPLCVGQNNGDGINTFSMCMFYSVLAPVFMSTMVIPAILFASTAASKRCSIKSRC